MNINPFSKEVFNRSGIIAESYYSASRINTGEVLLICCKNSMEIQEYCYFMNLAGMKRKGEVSYLCNIIDVDKGDIYFNPLDGTWNNKKENFDTGTNTITVINWNNLKMDLKQYITNGCVVETNNGHKYIVIGNRLIGETGFLPLSDYEANTLKLYKFYNNEYDIKYVYHVLNDVTRRIEDIFNNENLFVVWQRIGSNSFLNNKPLSEWHKEMWNWLADNPQKRKEDWINLQDFTTDEIDKLKNADNCFACLQAGRNIAQMNLTCGKCPICTRDIFDECLNGLYGKWCDNTGFKRAEAAHKIANLEWREK